jgi:hypothetical protein
MYKLTGIDFKDKRTGKRVQVSPTNFKRECLMLLECANEYIAAIEAIVVRSSLGRHLPSALHSVGYPVSHHGCSSVAAEGHRQGAAIAKANPGDGGSQASSVVAHMPPEIAA